MSEHASSPPQSDILGTVVWLGYTVLKSAAYLTLATSSTTALIVGLINFTPMDKVFARWLSVFLTRKTGLELSFSELDTAWSWSTRSSVLIFRDLEVYRSYESCERLGVSPNQTYLQVRIGRAQVELSAMWALQGKGLIRSLLLDHVRGVADRTHLVWSSDYVQPLYTTVYERMILTDLQMTVLQKGCAPLPLTIDSLAMLPYRWQWQFLDIVRARSLDGHMDGSAGSPPAHFAISRESQVSLFKTKLGQLTPSALWETPEVDVYGLSDALRLAGVVPIKLRWQFDGIDIRRIKENAKGPLSWLASGTLDMTLDCVIPPRLLSTKGRAEPTTPPLTAAVTIVLRNVHASIPLYDPSATLQETLYAQLARPLVTYLNSHPSEVRFQFDIQLSAQALDGAMGPWGAGLWDALSIGVAHELSRAVAEDVSGSLSSSWGSYLKEFTLAALDWFWNGDGCMLEFE